MVKSVEVYIDGTSEGIDARGAFATVTVRNGQKAITAGIAENTTSSRMDLMAAIHAIRNLKDDEEATIFTDSASIVHVFRQGLIQDWKARNWKNSRGKVRNHDLWQKVARYAETKSFKVRFINAKDKNENNQMAHQLAEAMLNRDKGFKRNQDTTIDLTNITHSLQHTLLSAVTFQPQEDGSILVNTQLTAGDGRVIDVRVERDQSRYFVDDLGKTTDYLLKRRTGIQKAPHPEDLLNRSHMETRWDPSTATLTTIAQTADEVGTAILSTAIAVRTASLLQSLDNGPGNDNKLKEEALSAT